MRLKKPFLKKIIVPIKNIPKEFNSFTIAQFCDIHVGSTVKGRYLKMIVEEINKLNSDLIVFTGDLVDGSVSYFKNDVEPCRELSAPYGKYFVAGYHEYYYGVLSWIEKVKDLGFNNLINEHKVLEK